MSHWVAAMVLILSVVAGVILAVCVMALLGILLLLPSTAMAVLVVVLVGRLRRFAVERRRRRDEPRARLVR